MDNNDQFPQELIIEVTNHCNLRCRYCHFHAHKNLQRRKLGFMEPHTWKKILDELEELNRPVNVMTHGAGEPFLYKHLFDLIEKAKKIPCLSVGFMCNGMLLDKREADLLVDLQVDFIAFSIDGTNPETHDYFRVNAKLEQIEKNILYLVEKKTKQGSRFPVLHFNMVGYPEILDQTTDYIRKWLPVAQSVSIAAFRPLGSRKLLNRTMRIPFKPCPLLWKQMVVSYDGKVGLCCEDINIEVPLGNLRESTLLEIYNHSQDLNYYRKKHLDKNIGELYLCSDCDSWSGDVILENNMITLDGMQIKRQVTPAFTNYSKVKDSE